jgi:hypothetical protein
MECYICFEEYTTKSGPACATCKKSCCGKCYITQLIRERRNPKCGLCRFDDDNRVSSLALIERVIVNEAKDCGFSIDKALVFKKQVQEMRKK